MSKKKKKTEQGVFPGPYFPVVRLNTEIYFVHLCMQSKYKKKGPRKNSVFGQFSCNVTNENLIVTGTITSCTRIYQTLLPHLAVKQKTSFLLKKKTKFSFN